MWFLWDLTIAGTGQDRNLSQQCLLVAVGWRWWCGDGGLWGRGQTVTELEAVHNGCLAMPRRQTVLGLGACPGPGRQGGRWDEMCLLSMCLCVPKSILGGQPLGARCPQPLTGPNFGRCGAAATWSRMVGSLSMTSKVPCGSSPLS